MKHQMKQAIQFTMKSKSDYRKKILIENIFAFCADNASVNYGVHNSVYVNLKNENIAIVKANCLCHVIHNTAKYAFMKFPIDIENLAIKIYSYFSTSSKKKMVH